MRIAVNVAVNENHLTEHFTDAAENLNHDETQFNVRIRGDISHAKVSRHDEKETFF